LAEAREIARRWKDLIARGIDPAIEADRARAAELRKQSDTVLAIAERFIARKLKAQRRGFAVERIIRNELLPAWGKRLVADITHRDIREVIERVVDRGVVTYGHNVFDAVNALLNFAAAQDAIETNPARLLRRSDILPPKKPRQRVLTDTELQALWRASERMGYPYGPMYHLLLLTGCRLDEVAGARWREFGLERKTWTIPAARFKSDAEHVVSLTDAAMAVLETLPRFERGDHLFSTRFGEQAIGGFSKAKRRLDALMSEEIELQPFINHDLRRTVRTRLSALKVQDHVAEMVIGHGRKGIARVYDMHKFDDEKREALTLWAAKLRSIVEPAPANVVQMSTRSA